MLQICYKKLWTCPIYTTVTRSVWLKRIKSLKLPDFLRLNASGDCMSHAWQTFFFHPNGHFCIFFIQLGGLDVQFKDVIFHNHKLIVLIDRSRTVNLSKRTIRNLLLTVKTTRHSCNIAHPRCKVDQRRWLMTLIGMGPNGDDLNPLTSVLFLCIH